MNIFIVAGVVSVIFFVIKFIEMRFIEKESKPLKYLVRDSLLVYFSVISGHFVLEQVHSVEGIETVKVPTVFTGNPEF
jgi:predicted glycosyltransferase